jgi:hypothetical protein
MANINLVTAGRIRVTKSIEQDTAPAGETILAGAPVRRDTTGRWTNANGTNATEANLYGIASHDAIAGEALTAWNDGEVDGFNLDALAYGASVFLSDTDGRLGDTAGTVSVLVGEVAAAHSQQLGVLPDKVLRLKLA